MADESGWRCTRLWLKRQPRIGRQDTVEGPARLCGARKAIILRRLRMRLFMWLLVASLLFGCVALPEYTNEPVQYAQPSIPAQMRTYTPEGYAMSWWIYEELDGSCTVEYQIESPVKEGREIVARGVIPCQMMAM